MERIDIDALYDERGDVSWTRPRIQGDVFRDIVLPGFGEDVQIVQVIAHPCAMRRGPDLAERVTVAPVLSYPLVEDGGNKGWDGHLKRMPLADLCEDGEHYATRFEDVTAAASTLLTHDRRIASLSNRGIYVLQQRLIKHYTRLTVDIPTLRKQSAPVLEEAEQERDWIETILDGEQLTVETIRAQSNAFDEWLSAGDPSRRDLLRRDENHRDIRRQAHAEAGERARQRRSS
ncbi:MAG: hypothetical protein U0990_06040 [Candidatus Nanopelagicales bacterium]|nr:hypothetical protein [Candidatus Nanopelagicales bacterium]MDZ4249633.1 hypothetical protein [Candidatus Nanopelagicales bacterium]